MEIKIKKEGIFSSKRIDVKVGIDNLIVKEDLLYPEKEKVLVFLRGNESSGILSFTREEIESLKSSLRSKTGLVKKVKSYKE